MGQAPAAATAGAAADHQVALVADTGGQMAPDGLVAHGPAVADQHGVLPRH